MRRRDRIILVSLVLCAFLIIFFRILRLGPSLQSVLPRRQYELTINMHLECHGEPVKARVALPLETGRQSIRHELASSANFRFHMARDGLNRWGIWELEESTGAYPLVYSCTVMTAEEKYDLAPQIPLPASYPAEIQPHLLPSDLIQASSPEIASLLANLVPEKDRRNVTALVRAAFDHAHRAIASVDVTGTTDAITCLRLGESSCGGKARLFAALCRAAGVPARLAGGLILKQGSWTQTHLWCEAWIGGNWVPFCPLNGHFAAVPENYLLSYYGDEPFFTHSRDINFRYYFFAKTVLGPPAARAAPPPGPFNLWAAFEEVRIPVDLLKIILMLPFGTLVVILARNIVGIETFGTFMPALIAVGFRETGLVWGLALFAAIILFGAALRFVLDRFQLLHTPRLAVILTGTVMFILGIAVFGVASGYVLPTRVSLFPLVILTLTVERFAILCEEDGLRKALTVTASTMLVACAAFAAMQFEPLQVVTVGFPEVLLLVVACFFVIGRWTGMRLLEYVRFRHFLLTGRRA